MGHLIENYQMTTNSLPSRTQMAHLGWQLRAVPSTREWPKVKCRSRHHTTPRNSMIHSYLMQVSLSIRTYNSSEALAFLSPSKLEFNLKGRLNVQLREFLCWTRRSQGQKISMIFSLILNKGSPNCRAGWRSVLMDRLLTSNLGSQYKVKEKRMPNPKLNLSKSLHLIPVSWSSQLMQSSQQ
jgi:hypothetical protein